MAKKPKLRLFINEGNEKSHIVIKFVNSQQQCLNTLVLPFVASDASFCAKNVTPETTYEDIKIMQYEDISVDPARALKLKIVGKKFYKHFKVTDDLFIFVENCQLVGETPRSLAGGKSSSPLKSSLRNLQDFFDNKLTEHICKVFDEYKQA